MLKIRRLLFLTLFTIGIGFYACARELCTGDLVFVGGSTSAFSKAITNTTAVTDTIQFDHVGIIEVDSLGRIFVIEANPAKGVIISDWDDFLLDAPTVDGNPLAVVYRFTVKISPEDIISRAKAHLGEPYDWWYLPDNGKMYCSELVYESYFDTIGNRLFEAAPMNFRTPDGSIPKFWEELFAKINSPVPEGVAGTNPADMAKNPCLIEVVRLF